MKGLIIVKIYNKKIEKLITLKKNLFSSSIIVNYYIISFIFLSIGIWLIKDLTTSRISLIKERSTLAVQTSGLMSQRFGNIITATDYVLRDITTKVTINELNMAELNPEIEKRLSILVTDKLSTLPNVYGLGFLNNRRIFIAAADKKVIGIKSNSKLNLSNKNLHDETYVDYVPINKSANKKPALLVSRPILSSKGDFMGGALAAIMLSSAQSWIESFKVGKYDTVSMIDENGVLIASNPINPKIIGTSLAYKHIKVDNNTSFVDISKLDGRKRIYGISKIQNVPLYIIVGFDLNYTLREWWQRLWQLSVGYVILIFLTLRILREHRYILIQRDEMEKLSITDPLTGLVNRRQIMLVGNNEIARAIRYKNKLSIFMVDIDHFKLINDTWGHPTGDRVIQFIANLMKLNVRSTDVVGRLGGEEFVVIMPETSEEGAYILANNIRKFVENSKDVKSDNELQISFTISIGVTSLNADDLSFEGILNRVDKALYEAKASGRNKVIVK